MLACVGMRRVLLASIVVLGVLAPAVAQAAPRPFGRTCAAASYGVRFCTGDRVPSWDGEPLDLDVTLPPAGDGPFPTVVMLHGYGGDKTAFESSSPDGAGLHYDNVFYAKHGYAVVNLSARGFGESCGSAGSRAGTPACDRGWFHLGDQRYDARDVQYLLGLLVDEGVANPRALGSTGVSLGSLTSLELDVLHDRIRLPDGTFRPWTSPRGVPLRFAAIFTTLSISSLIELISPNGRLMDGEVPGPKHDRQPIGDVKLSFPLASIATAPAFGYVAPPNQDPTIDFLSWMQVGLRTDPGDPEIARIIDELGTYHQSAGVPLGGAIAPLLMESGWSDEIVDGAAQAVRLYNSVRAQLPGAPISLLLSDVGHGRSASPPADQVRIDDAGLAFFDHHLRGAAGGAPAPGSVTAYTVGCPTGTPPAGPYSAPDWGSLDTGAVRFDSAPAQTISSAGGDPALAGQLDPLKNSTPCASYPAVDDPGTAVVRAPVKEAFTLLGRPTLRMDVANADGWAQLDARLWDEAPDGTQVLVTRGVYSVTPGQRGTITWQLFGGGYRFAAGHRIRLELLGQDPPWLRASLAPFTLTVGNVHVELPTHEPPDGGQIVAPLVDHRAPVAPACTQRTAVTVSARGLRRARVLVNGKPRRIRHGRVTVRLARARVTVVRVTGISRKGARVHRVRTVRRCAA